MSAVPEVVRLALRRRGLTLRADDGDDTPLVPGWTAEEQDRFYLELQRYSFRLVLRDVIRLGARGQRLAPRQLTRHASLEAVEGHLEQLVSLGLVAPHPSGQLSLRVSANSLGPTLEWFVAEVLRRELGFTVARGVPMRGGRTGGDLDVVALAEGRLLYVEVKSGPPKHLQDAQIAAFLERVDALAPHGAIFFEDTELRMADKVVPLFDGALAARGSALRPRRLQREIFTVGPAIFIANAHPDVTGNLTCCVSNLLRGQGVRL
jgi:hypothetical protein